MSEFLQIKRRECKYFLSVADYTKARHILKRLTESDGFHSMGDSYFIRSLYFDDIYGTAVDDKLAGVEFRDKFRLRSYGTDLDYVKLERKRKANEFITKISETLTRKEAEEIADGNYSCLLEKSPVARTLYVGLVRKGFRPIVLTDYEREAYTLPFNNIRITFDTNIRSNRHNLNLFDDSTVMKPILPPGVVVMEVKYNHFLPGWFNTTLQLDNPLRSAVSKYVLSNLQAGDFNSL